MYNGIGLRTVRGSGTNGYVQRNLSYVNASRTRQSLAHNQRGGSSGDFGTRKDGKNRPPPNADILLHEKKRKVELQLLEISLEMEEFGCDAQEIQDKIKRERERLLTRLHGAGDGGQEKAMDAESSHARQKRKEEENKRIKDAFGIASDYMVGESFDPEMQERRRQERKEAREKEREAREKERGAREEARQLRLKMKEEKDEKMKAGRERFHSRSRSKLVTRSRRSRSPLDRRSRGRDEAKLRKSHSRSPGTVRRSRSSAPEKRKRRSVSSSRSSRSSCSRSRSRTLRRGWFRGKDFPATKKVDQSRHRSASRSNLGSSSGAESDCSRKQSSRKKTAITMSKKLSISVSPARSAVLKGKHKVLDLSKSSTPICVVTKNESRVELDIEEEERSVPSPKRKKSTKECSPTVSKVKREGKHKTSSEQRIDKVRMSLPAARPVEVEKEGKTDALRSPRRSPSTVADARPHSRKRKLREDRHRRGRSTSSASSKASRSSRHRRKRSYSTPSDSSRSLSSDSSRSRSSSCSMPRSRRRSIPRRRRRSPSRSRGRGRRNSRGCRY